MTARLPWEPAVYEHKAALIGQTPGEVSRSAALLADAMEAEWRAYGADALTLGIDIYNIEAEACGAHVRDTGPEGCPEIAAPLFDVESLPETLEVPDMVRAGRCPMVLDAARRVRDRLPPEVALRVGISGPASIAAKLAGLQELVLALACEEDEATRLLDFCADIASAWSAAIRAEGCDVILFDSVAAPPVMSPAMMAREVAPLHARLMRELAASGQAERPLILGGDTTAIAATLAEAGATTLVCDFPADARAFAEALKRYPGIRVRRNVTPAIFSGENAQLDAAAQGLVRDCALFARPIAGTGILPYDTDPARVRGFRERLNRVFLSYL